MSDPFTNEDDEIASANASTKPENYAFIELHPDFIYAQHFNGCIGKRKITNLKNIKTRKTILGKLRRRNKNQSLISIVEKVFKEMLHHKIESRIRLNSF